jgi:hypothetical protein
MEKVNWIRLILDEAHRAEEVHSGMSQLTLERCTLVLCEEVGEAVKAVLDASRIKSNQPINQEVARAVVIRNAINETIQTAAAAYNLLKRLEEEINK